jgi:hypothetical protein
MQAGRQALQRAVVDADEGGCACCLLWWVQAKGAAVLHICYLFAAVGANKGGSAAACCGGCR